MADLTIKITGVPDEALKNIWNAVHKFSMKKFGEICAPSNNFEISFDDCMEINPDIFYQILGGAMTFHHIISAVKPVKE